ncbi:hypothetical protein [Paenibacillus amylolyticus]|uniref:hypothetical protein n=1 Tax=Paenibacillus amylolyticus TaxID=1451 RepID=UPI00339B67A4
MKYLRMSMLSIALLMILAGCSSDKSEQVELEEIKTEQQQPIQVEISVNAEFDRDDRLAISGNTNLPADMELMLSVKSEGGYSAQSKAYVYNSMFQSELFTSGEKGLPDGKYTVSITTPTANVQPQNVKEIIGEQGINLSGEYVKDDEIWGKMVEYSYEFSKGEYSAQLMPEDDQVWSTINGYLATGQYLKVAKLVDQLSNPSKDIQMMYKYAMYHVYGQDGEDEKSLESLYAIPSGYTGHNADLVSYYKYTHDSYEEGRSDPMISFDDYIKLYKNGEMVKDSYASYRSEQKQSSTGESDSYSGDTQSTDTYMDKTPVYNDSGDYNKYGEYKPVETMTPDEIRAELEAILEDAMYGQ